MTRLAVNGIALNVEVAGAGPPLLLLHGFTGSVETWSAFLAALAGYRTLRVDVIGHGTSDAPADPARYSMAHACADLVAVLDQLGVETTALLGYSMGGRVALHLALHAPERISSLILESASAGIADQAEREARRRNDEALADDIERDGMEAFVDRWQAQPLFASQSRLPAAVLEQQRRQRLGQRPRGLANSLRGMGAGAQDYLLPLLRSLPMPTLVLAGEFDAKYAAIAKELATVVPNCEERTVQAAGHAVHLEQPAAFEAAVLAFLAEHAPNKEAVR